MMSLKGMLIGTSALAALIAGAVIDCKIRNTINEIENWRVERARRNVMNDIEKIVDYHGDLMLESKRNLEFMKRTASEFLCILVAEDPGNPGICDLSDLISRIDEVAELRHIVV